MLANARPKVSKKVYMLCAQMHSVSMRAQGAQVDGKLLNLHWNRAPDRNFGRLDRIFCDTSRGSRYMFLGHHEPLYSAHSKTALDRRDFQNIRVAQYPFVFSRFKAQRF